LQGEFLMRKGTKIALAASALVLAGAAGLSSLAIADSRSSHGWGHHGMGHKGMRHHGMGHKGMRHHGMGHKGKGMHRMMERFDTNEDGKLTQEELDEARKKLLAAHDGDKDGKLSLAEFEKLWLEVKRQRMVRSFQRIDRDGDASITLDEFLKPYAKMIERMDRNDDGVLDSEDRRHKRGGMDRHGGMGQGGMGQGGMGKKGG
jgi:Ca2+-binding EF-hand superfamily protein